MRIICIMILAGLIWVLAAPSASAAVTCANVRCASGTCIDTPSGPTCQPRLTCANTLCAAGNKCIESAAGPRCVANSEGPYIHPRPPYIKPSPPQTNRCRKVRETFHGHTYYRKVCDPVTQPSQPHHYTPPRTYPDYGRGHNRRHYGNRYGSGHVGSPYYPLGHGYNPRPQPRPVPLPHPRPNPDIMCPAVYNPVCAQKAVQCVRAPCPSVQQTFGNSCEASRAGYSVLYQGTCR